MRCETGHFAFRRFSHPGHSAARHSLRVSGGAILGALALRRRRINTTSTLDAVSSQIHILQAQTMR